MTDVAASMGLSQLKKLNEFVKKREMLLLKSMRELLNGKYLYIPKIPKNTFKFFIFMWLKLKIVIASTMKVYSTI